MTSIAEQERFYTTLNERISEAMAPFKPGHANIIVRRDYNEIAKILVVVDILPHDLFETIPDLSDDPDDYAILNDVAEQFRALFRHVREPIGDHIVLGEN